MADLANVAFLVTSIGGSISGILAALSRFRRPDDDRDDSDYDDYEDEARHLERRAERLRRRAQRSRDDDDDAGPFLVQWRIA